MKKLLLSLLLLSSITAERASAATRYCELFIYQPGFKRYVGELTYSDTHIRKAKRIMGTNGKPIRFETRLDALAYMTNDGWDLVATRSTRHTDEVYYTLRKQS